MSGFSAIKTFDRYADDSAPQAGAPAASGVWAMRVIKFDAGAKLGFAEDNLRTIRALSHYRRKPGEGVEPFEVYITGNVAFEYVTSPLDFDVFDGSLSPQSSTDIGANQVVVGPDAPGVVSTGSPVLVAGQAAGIVRAVRTGTDGTLWAYGAINHLNGQDAINTPGAAIAAAAMQVGVSDGTNLQRLAGDTAGQALVEGANSVRATHVVNQSVTLQAAAAGLYSLEAPAGSSLRIRRFRAWQRSAVQTAAGFRRWSLTRYLGASSGGTVDAFINRHDPADSVFGGVGRVNPAGLGAAGDTVLPFTIWIPAALAAKDLPFIDRTFDLPGAKPLIIPAGTANCLVLFDVTGGAGAAGVIDIEIIFTVGA